MHGTFIEIKNCIIKYNIIALIGFIQGDSLARGPRIFVDNSLGPLAKESPCIWTTTVATSSERRNW